MVLFSLPLLLFCSLSLSIDILSNPYLCLISLLPLVFNIYTFTTMSVLLILFLLYQIGLSLARLFLTFATYNSYYVLVPLSYLLFLSFLVSLTLIYSSWDSLNLWIYESERNLLILYKKEYQTRLLFMEIEATALHIFFIVRQLLYKKTYLTFNLHLHYSLPPIYPLLCVESSTVSTASAITSTFSFSSILSAVTIVSLPVFKTVASYLVCRTLYPFLSIKLSSLLFKTLGSLSRVPTSSGLISVGYIIGSAPTTQKPFNEGELLIPRRVPVCSFRRIQSPYYWDTYKVGRGAVLYDFHNKKHITPKTDDMYLITLPRNSLPGWSLTYILEPGCLIKSLFWQINHKIYLHHHHSYVNNFYSNSPSFPIPKDCSYCITLFWIAVRSGSFIKLYHHLHDLPLDWSYELEVEGLRKVVFHPKYSDDFEFKLSPIYYVTLTIIKDKMTLEGVTNQWATAEAPYNLPLSLPRSPSPSPSPSPTVSTDSLSSFRSSSLSSSS